ncbi:MAG: hypothetical protein LBR73_01660 [Oscillospiraceae bacterium]|jgi:NRPS condensation-like uncharacterized protein|nr:hypothetical protein [Oscillospiraceae bacterium]
MAPKGKTYKAQGFDSFLYYAGKHMESDMYDLIEFTEHVDDEALKRAFFATCETIPPLLCGFDVTGLYPKWREYPGAAERFFTVEEYPDVETGYAAAQKKRIHHEQGPQIIATLVRTPERDALCMMISHLVFDALAFVQYVVLLGKTYGAFARGETPVMPPFISRGHEALFSAMPKDKRRAIARFQSSLPADLKRSDASAFNQKIGPRRDIVFSIPAETVQKAKAALKEIGCTLNDLLMASTARAWLALAGGTSVVLPCTQDMRRFAAPGAEIGYTNYAGKCHVFVEVPPGAPMQDTLRQVNAQMKKNKEGFDALHSVYLWMLGSKLPSFLQEKICAEVVKLTAYLTYSNVGDIGSEAVMSFGDTPIARSYMMPPPRKPPFFQVGAGTSRGQTILTGSFCGDDAALAFADSLFARIGEELAAFAEAA